MELSTKKQMIETVASRWKSQYAHYPKDDEKSIIGKRLFEEKPQTEDGVSAIIGNSSWTSNKCTECNEEREELVMLGEQPDYESSTVWICGECLKKALSILTPNP